MSTESNTSNTAHTIRMSDAEWNELLVTAVNAGYKSRAEYIRSTLKGERLWQSAPPPTDLEPELYTYKAKWQDATASLEVYTNDAARFLSRAETAEAELNAARAEVTTYRKTLDEVAEIGTAAVDRAEAAEAELAKLQAIKPTLPIMEKSNSTKKLPVHRFSLSSIVKRWPEARQSRYNKLGSPPDEWLKAALETAYDMLDEYEY